MNEVKNFETEVQCLKSLYVVPLIENFDNGNVVHAFLQVSSNWQDNSKPLYLSLLMNEKQLLSIINNKHLFDSDMVSAAFSLLAEYERIKIQYYDE